MIKRALAAVLIFLGVNLAAISEGVEYTKLKGDAIIPDAQNSVIELFSYACIHCYNHFRAGSLNFVSELLPDLKYEEWQVAQMGEYGREMVEVLVYAKMLDEKNGVKNSLSKNSIYKKIMQIYFDAHFKFRTNFAVPKDFYAVGVGVINKNAKTNITANDIVAFAGSQAGQKAIERMNEGFDVAKISGTPAFIVNGKYLVNMEKVDSVEKLAEIIKDLSKME